MAKSFIQKLFGTKQEKDLKQLSPIVKLVNAQADWARSIEDADFPKITAQLKKRLAEGETLEDLLP
ncbi:MAG: hypothetical protein PHS67_08070, partial [Sphaerochaetaceae bacterium]|nr:hypothetical protein [Sphaerochaetaceae bacterium]